MSNKTRQRTKKIASKLRDELSDVVDAKADEMALVEANRLLRINKLLAELDALIKEFEHRNGIRFCKRCGKKVFAPLHSCMVTLYETKH